METRVRPTGAENRWLDPLLTLVICLGGLLAIYTGKNLTDARFENVRRGQQTQNEMALVGEIVKMSRVVA